MQVILLERVEKLGQMGDEVKVKDGFARNFLLPRKEGAARHESQHANTSKARRRSSKPAIWSARRKPTPSPRSSTGKTFVMLRQAGERGLLYGSVSHARHRRCDHRRRRHGRRTQVPLDKAIKTLGLHDVKVVLHPEVRVEVTINVARTADEAERQANGENIALTAAQEARLDAEALFESAEAAARANLTGDDAPEAEEKEKPEPKKKKAAAEKPAAKAEAEAPAEAKPEKKKKEKKEK